MSTSALSYSAIRYYIHVNYTQLTLLTASDYIFRFISFNKIEKEPYH